MFDDCDDYYEPIIQKPINIYEMYEQGKGMGLGDHDVFPYSNPQRLTMKELKRRITEIGLTRDLKNDGFRGGAWSGD